jgi:hypothetical protein
MFNPLTSFMWEIGKKLLFRFWKWVQINLEYHNFGNFTDMKWIHQKQNPISQFEKQGLGILSIITFYLLLLDHQINALPDWLRAYIRVLAF